MHVYEAQIQYTKTLFTVSASRIDTPEKAVDYFRDIVDEHPYQETVWVLLLDNKSHPLFRLMITKGTLTACLVSPREVFMPALVSGAASVLLFHSHPSGDPSPSNADMQVTRSCRDAGAILGIPVVDHIILGHADMEPAGKGFYSFRSAGIL